MKYLSLFHFVKTVNVLSLTFLQSYIQTFPFDLCYCKKS